LKKSKDVTIAFPVSLEVSWKRLPILHGGGYKRCIKRLVEDYNDGPVGDRVKFPPGLFNFVNPRARRFLNLREGVMVGEWK
jgi:hypothetical protein